jgi:uncharacterized membrane protein
MRKWLNGGIVAAAWAFSLAVYSRLPFRVPTHWGLDGQVDGWSSRPAGAFFMPAVMVGIWALLTFLPRIDPRRENYAKFRGTYDAIVASVLVVMLLIHITALSAALGYDIPIARVIPFAVGGLFIVIGNLLPRARPNWFVGIRTPWTLSSDRVWERTHRLGGLMLVITGIALVIAGLIPGPVSLAFAIAIGFVTTAATLIYSYVAWRQERGGVG